MSSSLSSFFLSPVFIVLPRTVIIRAYIYIYPSLSLSLGNRGCIRREKALKVK